MGHEAAVAPEPGERALHDPAAPDNFKPALVVRAFDNLEPNPLSG